MRMHKCAMLPMWNFLASRIHIQNVVAELRTHWLNIQRPFASIELTLSSIHLLRLPREIRDQVKNTSSIGMHNEALRVPPALCSTLVIRPRLNSAKGYFFPKSGLSYVFVYDLMIYDHFLSTLWVFWIYCNRNSIIKTLGHLVSTN